MRLPWVIRRVLPLFSFLTLASSCGTESPPEPTGEDTTAPGSVQTLRATATGDSSIHLTWKAPGDDGTVGRAASYDLRYWTAPLTLAIWDTATAVVSPPAPSTAERPRT